MNFDPATLIAGFVVSGAGFVFFSYGKKLGRVPQMAAGLALMVFPLFVWNALAILAIGVGLIVALWIALRLGL